MNNARCMDACRSGRDLVASGSAATGLIDPISLIKQRKSPALWQVQGRKSPLTENNLLNIQYSSDSSSVVAERSASVIIQSRVPSLSV